MIQPKALLIRHLRIHRYGVLLCIAPLLGTCSFAQLADSSVTERFAVHAQATVINQFKAAFAAPYSGANSLSTDEESRLSVTNTLFLSARLWKGAEVHLNPEVAGGSGLSQTLGLAAATNGETFRIGDSAPQPYLARLFARQMFALGGEVEAIPPDANQLGGPMPQRYVAITVGKVGVADYFDDNRYSHDPRTQFMSWTLMGNGAWDYPANTRGYAPSIVLEAVGPTHALRYGFSLVPLEANGQEMDWRITQAGSHTLEYSHAHAIRARSGHIRLLLFRTVAGMGSYRQSLEEQPVNPVIESTRRPGRTKSGIGLTMDQELTADLGCFARASWNDGRNETWAFTEVDHGASAGLSLHGSKWKRSDDVLAAGYVIGGISRDHADYLAAGGKGFMLGDGALRYAPEHLAEIYYSASLAAGHVMLTGAYQFILNPGYNSARQGPVSVFSVRMHMRV